MKVRDLSIAVFFEILLLDSRTEVECNVVYEIRRLLRYAEKHIIKVQPNNTAHNKN